MEGIREYPWVLFFCSFTPFPPSHRKHRKSRISLQIIQCLLDTNWAVPVITHPRQWYSAGAPHFSHAAEVSQDGKSSKKAVLYIGVVFFEAFLETCNNHQICWCFHALKSSENHQAQLVRMIIFQRNPNDRCIKHKEDGSKCQNNPCIIRPATLHRPPAYNTPDWKEENARREERSPGIW